MSIEIKSIIRDFVMDDETKSAICIILEDCENRLFDSIKSFYKSRNICFNNSTYVIQDNEKLYNLSFLNNNGVYEINLDYITEIGENINLHTFLIESKFSNCDPYNFEPKSKYIISPYIHIEYEDIKLIEDFIKILNSIE